MVQGQYRAFIPVYIEESGDLVGCHRCVKHTDNKILGYSACLRFKALAESRNDNASHNKRQSELDYVPLHGLGPAGSAGI